MGGTAGDVGSRSAWVGWADQRFMAVPRRANHQSHPRILEHVGEVAAWGGSMLDCGVLSAVTWSSLVEAGIDVDYTGVDISPVTVASCRQRYPDVPWVVGDVRALDFPDDSFDCVLVRHVFEHLDWYQPALAEVRRVARRRVIVCLFLPLADRHNLVLHRLPTGEVHYNAYERDAFVADLTSGATRVHEEWIEDAERPNQLFVVDFA